MQDATWLLLMSAVFGLLVYVFFRLLFGQSESLREPPEPVDASDWTLVVDGSNFAHLGNDVELEYLERVISTLKHYFQSADIRVFCDANLRYKFNDRDKSEFESLVHKRGDTYVETHGKSADDVILDYADKHQNCIVVSNDWFAKGDEVQRRQGIPLLRVERSSSGEARPWGHVVIFGDPERPMQRENVPVGALVGS